MGLDFSISNFFITKTSLANKWMSKKIPSCSNSALVSKMNKLSYSFFHFCLFRNKDKFKVQEKASLSSFIKMVCALFCAKGPYFFRQNIQFTAYNNDVKFAHNLFCSLDISQKYIGILLPNCSDLL